MEKLVKEKSEKTVQLITTTELLQHWQGHRSLTRKVLEVFPEK